MGHLTITRVGPGRPRPLPIRRAGRELNSRPAGRYGCYRAAADLPAVAHANSNAEAGSGKVLMRVFNLPFTDATSRALITPSVFRSAKML